GGRERGEHDRPLAKTALDQRRRSLRELSERPNILPLFGQQQWKPAIEAKRVEVAGLGIVEDGEHGMTIVDDAEPLECVALLRITLRRAEPDGRQLLVLRARDGKELLVVEVGVDAVAGEDDESAARVDEVAQPPEVRRVQTAAVGQNQDARILHELRG